MDSVNKLIACDVAVVRCTLLYQMKHETNILKEEKIYAYSLNTIRKVNGYSFYCS